MDFSKGKVEEHEIIDYKCSEYAVILILFGETYYIKNAYVAIRYMFNGQICCGDSLR